MNALNRKTFEFNGKTILIDTEWLPHIRTSSDAGQSWESGTDMEFLTEKLGLNLNRMGEVREAFTHWCGQNPPVS